jgi:membrane associated rhomboid family serine protease
MIETSKQMALIPLTSFADIPIVGASGAVFGVLVAFGMLFPNQYVYVSFLLPIKAKYFVFGYAALELISGIRGSQDGIAHFAHIGGALVGFLLIKYWNRNLRKDFF